jgi:hypothetical protein
VSALGDELGRQADLDLALAELVVETAIDAIRARRPDLGRRVDRLAASRRFAARAAALIAVIGNKLDRR